MVYIRSLLYTLGTVITVPLFSLLALATFPFEPPTRNRIIASWAKTMVWWMRITCGLKYRVIGRENIPDCPSVMLAKHQSAWETIAFQAIFPPHCWVLKRELFYIPFLGWGLKMASSIGIDRGSAKQALKQVLEQGRERLKSGLSVLVFPEGTRVAPGEKGKYQVGGAWLASHTGAPVLPIAHNAGEFWRKNAFLKYPGTITVSIGPVIDPTGMKADALTRRAEEWIENEMARISAAGAQATRGEQENDGATQGRPA